MPKIICEDIPARSSVPEPQLVEQLVDVPTVLSVAVLQQRTAAAREEEEMEELLAVPPRLRTTAQWARLRELIGASSRARRRKRKKRRKRKSPRGAPLRRFPRARAVRSWNSGHFLRDGGASAARTWKPGLSTSHWFLAPTCSVPARLKSTGIFKFWGDDFWKMFHHCLAVDTRSCVGLTELR